MWKLYCLPGRALAELGYLFPGKGELWTSQRRRESGCAIFIFATIFWAIFGIFAFPMIVALSGSHSGTPRQASKRPPAEFPVSPSSAPDAVTGAPETRIRKEIPSAAAPRESAAPQPEREVKPRVVFAPPKEVVQPLPAATPPAPEN